MFLADFAHTLSVPIPAGELYDGYGFNMGFGYINTVISSEIVYEYS